MEATGRTWTTITLLLPLVESEVAPMRRTPQPEARRGSETILLVEDDEAVRPLARRMLEQGGYRTLAAASGEEALALVAGEAAFDLLATDIVMPGMSGLALATRLVDQRPDLATVFMSGYAIDLNGTAPHEGHRSIFLAKPYTRDALLAAVRTMLDGGLPDELGQDGDPDEMPAASAAR